MPAPRLRAGVLLRRPWLGCRLPLCEPPPPATERPAPSRTADPLAVLRTCPRRRWGMHPDARQHGAYGRKWFLLLVMAALGAEGGINVVATCNANHLGACMSRLTA